MLHAMLEVGGDSLSPEPEWTYNPEWKLIQRNTFTRWVNDHLKAVNKRVDDLKTDLSDGLRLISLVEVLSRQKFLKYNRRPCFRTQKLENVTMALRFLEDYEGLRLVNIDSSDIVDKKLKLILGLIWTLIIHYSITLPLWDNTSDLTPMQSLLAWIQSKIPEKHISNFTTDWNDGTAIVALVNAIAPGLCPYEPSWRIPASPLKNATKAMDAAEQWLDVPQLIKPDEMCNPMIDELSMMTYLSRFPNAQLKEVVPASDATLLLFDMQPDLAQYNAVDMQPLVAECQPVVDVKPNVSEYYGKAIQKTSDLQTDVCALNDVNIPQHVRDAMALVHKDIANRFYGCGLVVPDAIEGCTILDLGCGAGMDCFVLSRLVGANGHVTGLDMTQEQLDIATKYIDYHIKKFGYRHPNVNFVQGYIEHLTQSGIQHNFYDIIVSNCVGCLCSDKLQVLVEAYNVLKDGGEFYFSDLYCDRVLPDHLKQDPVLWGEGLAGALYWKDLYGLAQAAGFVTPRLVSARMFSIKQELRDSVGDAKFVAATYRLFKLSKPCAGLCLTNVTYQGTIAYCQKQLVFDFHHSFTTGKLTSISCHLAGILEQSRFSKYFTFDRELTDKSQEWVNPFVVAAGKRITTPCQIKSRVRSRMT